VKRVINVWVLSSGRCVGNVSLLVSVWITVACLQFGVKMTDHRIMAVVGPTGIGKSALLAKFASDAVTVSSSTCFSTSQHNLTIFV